MSSPQYPIANTPYIPYAIRRAIYTLGWQIVGRPQAFSEGAVYFCRDAAGLIEPYTARAILAQLEYLRAYLDVILALADFSTRNATRLCLPAQQEAL